MWKLVVFSLSMIIICWLKGLKLPKSPKERIEVLRQGRDYYIISVIFITLITFINHPDCTTSPIWFLIVGFAAAIPLLGIGLKIKKDKMLYGPNADMDVEELERAFKAEKALKDIRAAAILSIPDNAANPYDVANPPHQMTPEQRLDYQVYCEWVRKGKPLTNVPWYRT